jgi:ATP-dependent Clp protease protease subunit
LAIYDTMQMVSATVSTTCVGLAASMGTVLLSAGAKGRRYALPNSTIHIHQPWGGAQGQAVDIEIEARRIMRERERLNQLLAQQTGQTLEQIIHDTDRNYYMDAAEAVKYGLIDEVLISAKAEKKAEKK